MSVFGIMLQPALHPVLLVLLLGPAAGFVAHQAVIAARRGAAKGPWLRRVLLVVLCAVMLLRPGIPGGTSQTLTTDTDVFLVVDTTASSVAEDWDDDRPRLEGIRADVEELVNAYPGARFALITFDASAELRLPLTTDTTALVSSLEVLSPEVTSQSQGSSIAIAHRMLSAALRTAAEAAPERSRMVFYFGDGEQTASSPPESFAESADHVDGGAVFGYGTVEGGPMRQTTGSVGDAPAPYIAVDGQPALSVIDETALRAIADELGVEYQHRSATAAPDLPEAPTTTTALAASGTGGALFELYPYAAGALSVVLLIELVYAARALARMRGLAAPMPAAEKPMPAAKKGGTP